MSTAKKLFLVVLGGRCKGCPIEQHDFGVIAARSSASAKAKARQRWLRGQEQVHKDDLHSVQMDSAMDDLLPIQGNGQWYLKLTADSSVEEPSKHPDWYGYWKI